MLGKVDFLYVFNYRAPYFQDAFERLLFSIKSIKNQDVTVCISNNSPQCIQKKVSEVIENFKYHHQVYNGLFNKALCINYAVKNLVETDYFIISDVDLVYSKDHIQRLKLKIDNLTTPSEKIRFITYNYNLHPRFEKPKLARVAARIPFVRKYFQDENYYFPYSYSSDFTVLDQLPKSAGGFAHGNGLVHLETFMALRGYDEEMIGYGPEDGLFNTRISKVNRVIYDNLPDTASYHLWHPRFHMIQVEKNIKNWQEKTVFYNSLKNPTYEQLRANLSCEDWGVM